MTEGNGHSNGNGHRRSGYHLDTELAYDANGKLPWPDARMAPLPPLRAGVTGKARLDVAQIFEGKSILIIGTTGFVGKVALSMLLDRYPGVGKVYCLVRPGAGNTADERFFKKVAPSEAFQPLKDKYGAGYEAFMRSKITAVAGDIGRALCNFTDEMFAEIAAAGGIDVIINSAGLVSFTPPLESGLRINALGAKNVLETAKKLGARLVHVSTCYVAGRRDGDVWEDEPVVGYFPRSSTLSDEQRGAEELLDRDFDPIAEVADCQKLIDQAREQSNDRKHISQFREAAHDYLKGQRRDPDDENDLKLAVARERKIWLNKVLTDVGMERAAHWGWTNTYTYTKSLGEQIILSDTSVMSTIVRPAIVESSVRYPFPGWNEGFNTTAPLMYLMLKGHRSVPNGPDTALDIIPVDFIASGMLLATAAILAGEHEPVYQLGTSDANRISSKRLTELTALAVRRHFLDKADRGEDELRSRLRARLEGKAVTFEEFQRRSTPMLKRIADRLLTEIDDRMPKWGTPRLEAFAERAREELQKVSTFTGQVNELVQLFKPFTTDHDIAFRCDNMRALWARVSPEDQDRLLWAPHLIDWRRYWLDTHFPGLQKWTFDKLDEEFGAKPKTVYTYKSLLELFEATTKLHKNRVAFRLLPKDEDAEPITYTYAQFEDCAWRGAAWLRQHGVGAGDRVMIMGENSPDWVIGYFSIILAGAIAVPLDKELTTPEVVNLANASQAKIALLSPKVAARVTAEGGLPITIIELFDLQAEPDVAVGAVQPDVKGDQLASIIFTSGTTGTPKGVMLTHKNLTAMTSKLSSLFTLYKHDTLLSVLPLHHTLEFSAGFLMPLMHGASIDYLEEIEAESLQRALQDEGITGMVGVPALWQLLERKIYKNVSDAGVIVEKVFDTIVDLNRTLRDKLPWDIGAGKVLFFPVHRKLGGRMRLLISGASALPTDTLKAFRGLGFNLFEGYGMTESSPVLTVMRPGDKPVFGSVGRPLPGIDVRIDQPDAAGIGEIVAKGPNVMQGYYQNAEATAATLKDGWLHTGDLGRIDGDGNVFIVGRKKEMILGASGENIYPDELEEAFRDSKYVKELSVVGLPLGGGMTAGSGAEGRRGSVDDRLESVAMLVVPDYDHDGMSREAVREAVREHIKKVNKTLALYKRPKVIHLTDIELPKTASRKPKRREVVKELQRIERAAKGGATAAAAKSAEAAGGMTWLHELLAGVAQKPKTAVISETRLEELGFDSLMFTELAVALEAADVNLPDPSELTGLETVADVEKLVSRLGAKARSEKPKRDRLRKEADARNKDIEDGKRDDDIHVPKPLVSLGRRALRGGMKALYERVLDTDVYGSRNVPPFGGYIVAANHASHLDTGLVKYALGEQGDALVALGAKDYFFDDPFRRMYFENFTNVVPMERHGSLRESLRLAGEVIRNGYILLIFPEGTRSDTGVMTDFKPSLGYLAMTNKCGILPMYLAGTHEAMPKGKYLPKRGERVASYIGPYLSYEDVAKIAGGATRSEQYRAITYNVESTIRRLAPRDQHWTLGDAGTTPQALFLAEQGLEATAEEAES